MKRDWYAKGGIQPRDLMNACLSSLFLYLSACGSQEYEHGTQHPQAGLGSTSTNPLSLDTDHPQNHTTTKIAPESMPSTSMGTSPSGTTGVGMPAPPPSTQQIIDSLSEINGGRPLRVIVTPEGSTVLQPVLPQNVADLPQHPLAQIRIDQTQHSYPEVPELTRRGLQSPDGRVGFHIQVERLEPTVDPAGRIRWRPVDALPFHQIYPTDTGETILVGNPSSGPTVEVIQNGAAYEAPHMGAIRQTPLDLGNMGRSLAHAGQTLLEMNPHLVPLVDDLHNEIHSQLEDYDPTGGYAILAVETGVAGYGAYQAAAGIGTPTVVTTLGAEALATAAVPAAIVTLAGGTVYMVYRAYEQSPGGDYVPVEQGGFSDSYGDNFCALYPILCNDEPEVRLETPTTETEGY